MINQLLIFILSKNESYAQKDMPPRYRNALNIYTNNVIVIIILNLASLNTSVISKNNTATYATRRVAPLPLLLPFAPRRSVQECQGHGQT